MTGEPRHKRGYGMRGQKAREGSPNNGVGCQYHSEAPKFEASIQLALKSQ
jgi:hypothetical protein